MGANFQVFLITNVPARGGGYSYQCVGAFNHYYCFGVRPLRALYRFFSLLRVRQNAALVRDELRSFSTWNLQGDPLDAWMNPAVPCPYAVSLLSIAWTIDLEHLPYISNYSLGNGLLDARKDCWHRARQGIDQEGICVVNISNIQRPAYCFVRKTGARAGSAWQYLCEVHPSRFHRWPRDWSPEDEELPLKKETEDRCFMHALEAFWALVDLAGYPLIPASTLLQIWPNSVARSYGPKQVKVPENDDLPMPLDIAISLYLGLTDRAFPAAFARVHGVDDPILAIGKAILPPYELGPPEDTVRRTFVVQAILADWRPFEYVLDPPYPSGAGDHPPYTTLGELEQAMHWDMECKRTIGISPSPTPPYYPHNPYNSKGLHSSFSLPMNLDHTAFRVWASQPSTIKRLNSILRPEQFHKAVCKFVFDNFGDLPPLSTDIILDMLWLCLHDLTDTTFLDLSDLQLSPDQLMKLLNRTPGVEALSLSGNSKVKPEHLPAILNSSPTLRRVHCMHWSHQMLSKLLSVRSARPKEFRQLEGLICPPLLSCNYAAPPLVSFAFQHNTRVSIEDSHFVSVPFFTPSQVVQSVADILPLAFQENRYGESAHLWMRGFAIQTGPNVYANPAFGVPLFMASPMAIRASLSGGAPRPGQTWNERHIVSVPSYGETDISQSSDDGIWVFHFDWDHRRDRFRTPGRNQWGFIHYEVAERCTMPTGLAPAGTYPRRGNDADGPQAHEPPKKAHHLSRMIFSFMPGPHDEFAGLSNYVSDYSKATTKETSSSPSSEGPASANERRAKSPTTSFSAGVPPAAPEGRPSATGNATPMIFAQPLPADAAVPPASSGVHHLKAGDVFHIHSTDCQASQPEDALPPPSNSSEASPAPAPKEHEWLRFVGTVYDLHGFLRCMADEGRPLPDREAVEQLERILDTRDPTTSTLVCGLMAQDAELPLSGWRRTHTGDERKERFYEEYGGLATGPDAHFWTPSMFPARVTTRRASRHGASDETDSDSEQENCLLPML